jgi:predicted DNA-binding protein (MmcQ/YjbR family)
MTPAQAKKARAALREFALGLPGAYEDFPWGDGSVAKVNKKIFCVLGVGDPKLYPLGITVKIPALAGLVTSLEACELAGYGLGKSGWVAVAMAAPDCPDLDTLLEWVEDSYRLIAPKKLVKELDG